MERYRLIIEIPILEEIISIVELASLESGYTEELNIEETVYFANRLLTEWMLYGTLTKSDYYHDICIISEDYGVNLERYFYILFKHLTIMVSQSDINIGHTSIEDLTILPARRYMCITTLIRGI